ncbi:MAG TPA: hypothetical protein VGL56_19395 [Fimbriimonadaceae bacterium]|jgi:hypothetical protein
MNDNECAENILRARRKVAATNLKRCPVCEALNAVSNNECFVCTWRGKFSHDPMDIEDGLRELLTRCPEYKASTPQIIPTSRKKRSPKWRFLLRRVINGPIDFSV